MTNFYLKLSNGVTFSYIKDHCDFDEYSFFDGRVYDSTGNLVLCLEERSDESQPSDSFIQELYTKAFELLS